MSDLRDYEYDIFVSYKRNSFSRGWIRDEFIGELESRVEVELGRRPRTFWDDTSVDDGNVPTLAILHALRTSRLLLSILSGPYFESKWCTAEWETFHRRAQVVGLTRGRTLTIPIQWSDGERYLPLLIGDGPRPVDFTQFRIMGLALRGATDAQLKYQVQLDSLAAAVVRLIQAAPPFSAEWPLIDPATVEPRQASAGSWTFKLGPDPAQQPPPQ